MTQAEQVHRFQAALDRMYEGTVSERFKITGYDASTIYEMLLVSYKREVACRRMEFTDDEHTKIKIQNAAKWLTGDHKVGLLLYGSVGSGKSTLARAICSLIGIIHGRSSWESERKNVLRLSALELANRVAEDPSSFNKLKSAELIFIDDIGTEPASVKNWGNEFSPVVDLLYSRYDKQLFTIATSNLNDAGLHERYGVRISDRLKEMFDRIVFSGQSYRR